MYFLQNQFIGSNLKSLKLGFIIVPNCFFLWFKAEPQCVTYSNLQAFKSNRPSGTYGARGDLLPPYFFEPDYNQ